MKRAILLGSLLSTAVASQTFPLAVERTSGTVLTVGKGCSADAPCNVRIGSVVHTFLQDAAITVQGGTGTAYIYVAANGQLTVGHTLQVQCARCTAAPGVSDFPVDAVPLWTWTVSNGKWDDKGADLRAMLGAPLLTADTGIILTRKAGETRIGLSPALLARRSEAPQTASSECSEGDWAFDPRYLYVCVAANQWRRASLETW